MNTPHDGPPSHAPRSADVEALHQQIFMRVHDALDGKITKELMSKEVWLATEEAARSIAAMIEGE
jgi:hypothetical protein